MVGRLESVGWRVHAVPTVAIEALEFSPPDLNRFDWVVVTSAEGARALLARSAPGGARWAAVGPATAAALGALGVAADAVPEQHRGVQIADAIAAAGGLAGRRILLARADAAASDLPRALRERGATVEELAVYHTVVGPEVSRGPLASALADPGLRAAVVCSGSAVRGLRRLAPAAGRLPLISIGPATSEVARAQGMQVAVEAARADLDSLVEAARAYLESI